MPPGRIHPKHRESCATHGGATWHGTPCCKKNTSLSDWLLRLGAILLLMLLLLLLRLLLLLYTRCKRRLLHQQKDWPYSRMRLQGMSQVLCDADRRNSTVRVQVETAMCDGQPKRENLRILFPISADSDTASSFAIIRGVVRTAVRLRLRPSRSPLLDGLKGLHKQP